MVDPSATADHHHLLLCIVEPVGVFSEPHATDVTGASPAEQEALRVNRFESRRSAVTVALAVCGLAAAAALSGCSAGQISQTSTQQAAVNGTAATAGNITLRNVHLRAPQSTDYV